MAPDVEPVKEPALNDFSDGNKFEGDSGLFSIEYAEAVIQEFNKGTNGLNQDVTDDQINAYFRIKSFDEVAAEKTVLLVPMTPAINKWLCDAKLVQQDALMKIYEVPFREWLISKNARTQPLNEQINSNNQNVMPTEASQPSVAFPNIPMLAQTGGMPSQLGGGSLGETFYGQPSQPHSGLLSVENTHSESQYFAQPNSQYQDHVRVDQQSGLASGSQTLFEPFPLSTPQTDGMPLPLGGTFYAPSQFQGGALGAENTQSVMQFLRLMINRTCLTPMLHFKLCILLRLIASIRIT